MGNRLTKTADGVTTSYVYDLCNKLLSETTGEEAVTYSYDVLGNQTTKTEAGGITTYTYDALNQLTEVVNPDGSWQRNTYDASGIRSMVAENGITTEFMTFSALVISGYDKRGEQTEHYFYGSSLIAAEYSANYMAGDTERGNVAVTNVAGEVTESAETSLYYYLKNSHGDVIGLTDNAGTLTETYRYDAFGTLTKIQSLKENGVLAETDTALSRFLYAGEQYDKVTGLYYLRARQYDTLIGRFTQEDTYLGDGRNLYAYVSNNPLKYVDPSGHGREDIVTKGITINEMLEDFSKKMREDGSYALVDVYTGVNEDVHEQLFYLKHMIQWFPAVWKILLKNGMELWEMVLNLHLIKYLSKEVSGIFHYIIWDV